MKDKKKTLGSGIIICAISGIILTILIGYLISTISYNNLLDSGEISQMEETNIEIPSFTIVVRGLYDGTITNLDLEEKDVPVYEFDAGVSTSFGVFTNTYVGVRLSDVLEAMELTDFSEINFYDPNSVTVNYTREEVLEDTYIVFYRNGERITEDGPANLLSLRFNYTYSVEDLVKIELL